MITPALIIAREMHLKLGTETGDTGEQRINARRVDVNPPELEGVIGTAFDARVPWQERTAAAKTRDDPGDVTGSITNQRRSLFTKGSDHHLAPFTVR